MSDKQALIWNQGLETMARPELAQLQLARLKEVVARVAATVPFYRDLYAGAGVSVWARNTSTSGWVTWEK